MTEQAIQANLIEHLKGLGAYTVKTIAVSKAGVPDILCCLDGRFIGIEVKRPEKKENVTRLQQKNLDWIIDAGGLAGVAWDVISLEEILNADNV